MSFYGHWVTLQYGKQSVNLTTFIWYIKGYCLLALQVDRDLREFKKLIYIEENFITFLQYCALFIAHWMFSNSLEFEKLNMN